MKSTEKPDPEELKQKAFKAIENERDSIFRLSRFINENPETAYREEKASYALADFLSERGFNVTLPAGGLETAFKADFNSGGTCNGSSAADHGRRIPVAFIAEYDALEGIGHGCGHNLIAAAAAAAALGTAEAVKSAESSGRLNSGPPLFSVIGTPAEEILSETAGKNRLISAGVFKEIDACLIFHPWKETGVALKDLGCTAFRVTYHGRAAHAAADPWNGLNALDAAVLFYNSMSMLRQQLPPGTKLHSIISEGGSVLNIIPERSEVEVLIRSTELDDLIKVEDRIKKCAESAAVSAGCKVEFIKTAAVKPILFNRQLFRLAEDNSKLLGEELVTLPVWEASSDFGDVSREVPSLSLLYKTHGSETCWHSEEAALEAHSDKANEEMLRAAKILAATAIDLIYSNRDIFIDNLTTI